MPLPDPDEERRADAREQLITDPRAEQRPCEAVEERLHHLQGDAIPLSEFTGEYRVRPHADPE